MDESESHFINCKDLQCQRVACKHRIEQSRLLESYREEVRLLRHHLELAEVICPGANEIRWARERAT